MMIFNLTQHPASPEQIGSGVTEPTVKVKEQIIALLNFTTPPTHDEMMTRAKALASLVPPKAGAAMIGGAGFFMSALEKTLRAKGITPLHAFSTRESVEKIRDGQVIKTSVFRHIGFVS